MHECSRIHSEGLHSSRGRGAGRRLALNRARRRCSWGRRSATVERVTIQRMDHVGIVVDDLAAATEFFVEVGRLSNQDGPTRRLTAVGTATHATGAEDSSMRR